VFAKKSYLKIIAEKPDIFGRIPENVLPEEKIEELRKIPRLAIGEFSCIQGLNPIISILSQKRPDAFMPTFSYTGTDYGEWKNINKILYKIKKTIEKDLRIYYIDPLILGAPDFWRGLNGRFAYEIYQRFGVHCLCYGCRLYSFALRIPLCKKINAKIFIYGDTEHRGGGNKIYNSPTAMKYYKNLMSSFGIDIWYNFMNGGRKSEMPGLLAGCENGMNINCVFSEHFCKRDGSFDEPSKIDNFFETYAIPTAAKIVSRVLAGVDVDYAQEAANTLFPDVKKKTGRFKRKQ